MRGQPVIHLTKAINFFKQWTPEMAYVTGLLFADGCVNKRLREITLELKDGDLVQQVAHAIDPNLQVYFHKRSDGRTSAKFQICRQAVVQDCLAIGLTPRKSLNVLWPKSLPKGLEGHFTRGYFDGNGTVNQERERRRGEIHLTGRRLSFSCASLDFLHSLQAVILDNIGVAGRVEIPYPTASRLEYIRRNEILAIGEWMYANSEIRLERKYEHWQKVSGKTPHI